MGIREEINTKPALGAAAVAGLVVLAAVAWYAMSDGSHGPATRAFYSDDDGATYFADDATKLVPFDRNGKPAYRAYVFRVGEEPPKVGYLARYSEATKAKIESLRLKKDDPTSQAQLAQTLGAEYEVRKPGTTSWVAVGTPEGGQVTQAPSSKDGKTTALGVTP